MALNEVFPNPTVKEVVFEVRFPNLFYIEEKIGEFQLRILDKFPDSSLSFKHEVRIIEPTDESEKNKRSSEEIRTKIWRFNNPNGVSLSITSNNLSIVSTSHKTYNNQRSDNKFRDTIESALNPFLDIIRIPTFSRIGLRYIDAFPPISNNNEAFNEYFNSAFNLERLNFNEVEQVEMTSLRKKGEYSFRFAESINLDGSNNLNVVLDFDGYAKNIQTANYLSITDELHQLISVEFEQAIKEPVLQFMRQQPISL